MPSVASVATTSSLWLAFMSTCCIYAFPSQYRRSYQYYPPMMADVLAPSQWDVAQEPLSYEQPEDYYDNSQWADVEALSNLIEMYDNSPPVWGQVIHEKPEEELQELKRSSAPQKRQRPAQGKVTMSPPHLASSSSYETSTSKPTPVRGSVSSPVAAGAAAAAESSAASSSHHHHMSQGITQTERPSVQVFQRGQKEVPLLRPPNKSRIQQQQQQLLQQSSASGVSGSEPADTGVVSALLTSTERQKKPSAYDTLRKYLSLEDALEKEKEKRRIRPQQQKRSKNFVAEEGSLTGQLNNLKKSVV